MKFLDTNVFLRSLVRTDAAKAEACAALFRAIDRGEEAATTSEGVVCEIAYILRAKAHYRLEPEEIAKRLRPMLSLRGLTLEHKRAFLRALDLWELHPRVDFEDVVSVAHMERMGLSEIVSYDRDFDQFPGVNRAEP